jgi:hypothetical protein
MNDYILPHHLTGERQLLEFMARLLDLLRTGSISQWLAPRVAPGGRD